MTSAKRKAPATATGNDRYHHGDLRAALITAGREMIEEADAAELSLRAAARRVGVSPAAPAHHFGDKVGLLAAIAAKGFDELRKSRLAALEVAVDAEDAVGKMIDTYVDYALANAGVFRLMFGSELTRGAHPELYHDAKASFEVFTDALERYCEELGIASDKRDLVTMTAWSLEHGLALLLLSRQIPLSLLPVKESDLRESARDIFLRGVRDLVR